MLITNAYLLFLLLCILSHMSLSYTLSPLWGEDGRSSFNKSWKYFQSDMYRSNAFFVAKLGYIIKENNLFLLDI